MENLAKKYYGNKDIAIILNDYNLLEDVQDYGRNEDGYYTVCNGQFVFKDFVALPGVDPDDEFGEPDMYLDFWDEASQFDVPKFIIARKVMFAWYPDDDEEEVVDDFNEYFDTDFTTFEECWNYAASEEDEDGEPWGLGFSANVVEDFEEM